MKEETKKEIRSKSRRKPVYLFLTVICVLAAVLCLGIYVNYRVSLERQSAKREELEVIVEPKPSVEDIPTEEEQELPEPETEEPVDLSMYNIPEKELDFSALQEENEDIYAWLLIPETNVDEPVLQHPEELDYYLGHNVDGSEGYPGCLYTQFLNSKNWDDFNTVIYGHNMKNGSMFHDLHYYEDSEFFDAHPYIYVYTQEGPLVYQIFAAYEFSNLHLLMGFDLEEEETRQIYLDNIYASEGLTSNFNRDIPVGADDRILTLSTCVKDKADRRYLIAAVLAADGRTVQ